VRYGRRRDRFSRANFCGERGGRPSADTRDRVRLLAFSNRVRMHGDERRFPLIVCAPRVSQCGEREEEKKMVPQGLGSDIVAVS